MRNDEREVEWSGFFFLLLHTSIDRASSHEEIHYESLLFIPYRTLRVHDETKGKERRALA